jgi:long-subunit acyl-CoA synthetase (AMP-forming)
MNVHYMIFDVKSTSMTTLSQRFLDQSPDLSPEAFPLPSPSDIALYLHTSSASSISNLKCVPLAHESIISGVKSRVAWWKTAWPDQDFKNLRVLGWSPWSHILGICHDLGGAMFATAGCYCFGVIPSTYTSPDEHEGESDVLSRLFDAAIRLKPDVFVGVPWVLEGFKDKWSHEKVADKKEAMREVLEKMKVFGCGGAALSKELVLWAKGMNISVTVDIGMTELGSEYALDLNPSFLLIF